MSAIYQILSSIVCEIGQADGVIANLPDVPGNTRRLLFDEVARRAGLFKALWIAADVVDVDAPFLAAIADRVGAVKLATELRTETEGK